MIGMFVIYVVCIYLLNGIEESRREEFQNIEMQIMGEQSEASVSLINQRTNYAFLRRCFKKRKTNKKALIIAALISIFLPLFFYKTCISFYNDEIGYTSNFFGPALNTYWARLLELKRACPPGPPCHVYATIPEDPTTAFFLNMHTYPDIKSDVVVYYQ
jgi:hypothetical protein